MPLRANSTRSTHFSFKPIPQRTWVPQLILVVKFNPLCLTGEPYIFRNYLLVWGKSCSWNSSHTVFLRKDPLVAPKGSRKAYFLRKLPFWIPTGYVFMYVYMCSSSRACVPGRTCVGAGERTNETERLEKVCVISACVCDRACVRPCMREWVNICKIR